MIKWQFSDVMNISPSAVHHVCHKELNFTHKVATKVLHGARSKLTRTKRKITLYLLASLNLQGYIPVAIDE